MVLRNIQCSHKTNNVVSALWVLQSSQEHRPTGQTLLLGNYTQDGFDGYCLSKDWMSFLFFRARFSYHQWLVPLQNKKLGCYQMITILGKFWKITEYRALNWSTLGLEYIWPYGWQPQGQKRIQRENFLRKNHNAL